MTNAETVAREMRAVVEKLESLSYAKRLIARWLGMLEKGDE